MVWRYYFGFKLSQRARQKLEAFLQSRGYEVLEFGWESVTISTQLSGVDKTTILDLKNLFKEEEV